MTLNAILQDPYSVEFEITSKCTLACSECPRTTLKSKPEIWNFGELDISIIEKVASSVSSKRLVFCGGYGDPIYHSRLFDIIDICHRYEKIIHLETCGNLRSKDWWHELARRLHRYDAVHFSVDGLAHNNHLYRKNANWDSIYSAMEIMGANAKCRLAWKWILFKYNENDILEGYKLCKKLNIPMFRLVESGRLPPGFEPTKTYEQAVAEIEEYKRTLSLDSSVN